MAKRQESDHREKLPLTLGALLKARREAARLTQADMAAKLRISRTYLARLEHGERKQPSPALLAKIIENLDIKADDLYAITGIIPSSELPSLRGYLRARHPDWPEPVIAEIDDFCDFIADRNSLPK